MYLAPGRQHGEVDQGPLLAVKSGPVPDGAPAEGGGKLLHSLGKLGAAVLEGVVDVGVPQNTPADGHAHIVEGLLELGPVGLGHCDRCYLV